MVNATKLLWSKFSFSSLWQSFIWLVKVLSSAWRTKLILWISPGIDHMTALNNVWLPIYKNRYLLWALKIAKVDSKFCQIPIEPLKIARHKILPKWQKNSNLLALFVRAIYEISHDCSSTKNIVLQHRGHQPLGWWGDQTSTEADVPYLRHSKSSILFLTSRPQPEPNKILMRES